MALARQLPAWPGPARSSSLRSIVLRVVVPRVAIFAVVTTILGLARVLAVQPSADPATGQDPPWMPSWTAADQRAHPSCVPSLSWPDGKAAEFIVGYSFREGLRGKVAFADAWRWNHNQTEVDDIWVLGVCPSRHVAVPASAGSR